MRFVGGPIVASSVTSVSTIVFAGENPNGNVTSIFIGQQCLVTGLPAPLADRLYVARAAGVNNAWVPLGP